MDTFRLESGRFRRRIEGDFEMLEESNSAKQTA